MRRAASMRPRSASSTAWQRSATDSTAGAPAVMRSTRTTSRQRPLARVTGLGPHRAAGGRLGEDGVGEAAVAGAAGRGEGGVERPLGGADLPEPLEREGVDVVRLGLAGEVADAPAWRAAAAPIDCTISVSRSGSASTASWPS